MSLSHRQTTPTGDAPRGAAHAEATPAAGAFRVRDPIILRDERGTLASSLSVVADPSSLQSWHVDPAGLRLLDHLRTPRTLQEVQQQWPIRSSAGAAAQFDVAAALAGMVEAGIVEPASPSAPGVRPVCRRSRPPESRYQPAIAPFSMAVWAPMEPRLFARLVAEADALGVLGIDFHGGQQGLSFVASASPLLSGLRSAISFWLAAGDVGAATVSWLTTIAEGARGFALRHPPRRHGRHECRGIGLGTARRRFLFLRIAHDSGLR